MAFFVLLTCALKNKQKYVLTFPLYSTLYTLYQFIYYLFDVNNRFCDPSVPTVFLGMRQCIKCIRVNSTNGSPFRKLKCQFYIMWFSIWKIEILFSNRWRWYHLADSCISRSSNTLRYIEMEIKIQQQQLFFHEFAYSYLTVCGTHIPTI